MEYKILLVLTGLWTLQACTKTEVVPYEKEPTNHIIEYKVTNATETLYGVVDDIDNTITVYLPYYLSIDYIVPEIILEEGATLIDATGNEIDTREDIEPVHFDSVGYTYRVRDDKNTIRVYILVTKILPHVEPLKLGYFIKADGNGNYVADEDSSAEALVNSRLAIYGNLESSSRHAKLTLVDQKTNTVIPGALKLNDVTRADLFHYITVQISPEIDSGYYYIVVQHQGRTDTLPSIHMIYKKPFFDYLGKAYAVGDTVTLNVRGSDMFDNYSGVNTGISRMYAKLVTQHLTVLPANFPQGLLDIPIDVKIVSQSRTQVRFIFPELPLGKYETAISSGSGIDGFHLGYSGFGFYFDFNAPTWGKDNLLSTIPYNLEITAKK
jgi:hypothetical protein